MTKPRLDQGPDYERGFIDGMQHQMQSSVDKAVNRMAQPQQCRKEQRGNGECVCNCKLGECPESAQPDQEPVAWLQFRDNEPPVVAPRGLGTPVFLGIRGGLAHDAQLKEKNT